MGIKRTSITKPWKVFSLWGKVVIQEAKYLLPNLKHYANLLCIRAKKIVGTVIITYQDDSLVFSVEPITESQCLTLHFLQYSVMRDFLETLEGYNTN